jgi:3-hydroxybutyryl-CoA dehydrogenase
MTKIQTIGVCGLGQMGAAVAVSFKRAGYRVLAWDHNPVRLESLPATTTKLDLWLDEHVGLTTSTNGIIEAHADTDTLDEESDVILDCIAEDMALKVGLFNRFPGARERNAIFITTTSGLSITQMGQQSGCGHLLAGTHFWNPPHLMPLVEVIRGNKTPDWVMDSVCELVTSIGKIPVRVNKDVPGFIGNRLLHALWREAISLVEQDVATPEDIDLVARLTFGLRLPVVGPLENMDLVGLDLIERIHQYLLNDIADNHGPSELLTKNVHNQRLGMKTGQGFYDWKKRSGEELIERRDKQIVHQLEYLKELEEQQKNL